MLPFLQLSFAQEFQHRRIDGEFLSLQGIV